jgi:hypothetical protein
MISSYDYEGEITHAPMWKLRCDIHSLKLIHRSLEQDIKAVKASIRRLNEEMAKHRIRHDHLTLQKYPTYTALNRAPCLRGYFRHHLNHQYKQLKYLRHEIKYVAHLLKHQRSNIRKHLILIRQIDK